MKALPTWAERLLKAICPNDVFDQIAGDLIELYHHDSRVHGARKAKLRLASATLRFVRPGIILRKRISVDLKAMLMLHHYLKTSIRHFKKTKLNFTFKVAGLVMALSSFLIIVLYVAHHLSFDRYHEDYERIYRVNSQWRENGMLTKYAVVPSGVGPMLKRDFPEVRSYTTVGNAGSYLVRYDDRTFPAEGIAEADSTVFDVFTFRFLQGDKRALVKPNSIVMAKSMANQIFGKDDPMHKLISLVDRPGITLEVTAVIEDLPVNTHLYLKAMTSYQALQDGEDVGAGPWDIGSIVDGLTTLYVRTTAEANANDFVTKASPAVQKRITRSEGLEAEYSIFLQPLKDIYLDPSINAEAVKKGNAVYVYAFIVLGIFLLIISSINYLNLSIADFHKRQKEIGVRKMMGAQKRQIAFQVVLESTFVALLSLIASVGLVYLFFPEIVGLLEPDLRFEMLMQPALIAVILCIMVLLIVLSTAYPAYSLAVNQAVNDLKPGGKVMKSSTLSSVLLLSQFTISVICICATCIVSRQLEFIQARNPGYDRHNMVVAYMPDRYPPGKDAILKQEFAKLTGVDRVSFSTFRIAGAGYFRDWYRVEINGEMKRMLLNEVFFDHDFFSTTGIPLIAGRSFDPALTTDAHQAFIVNEAAVREFGWKEAIGKRIQYGYDDSETEKWEGTIIGVVKDFNVYSFHRKIEPLVMRLPWSDWPGSCIHVRISGPLQETIIRLKKKYEEVLPGFVLSYSVVDDLYNNQYQNERKTYTALHLSTWIIVLISSLGIFSLSLYVSLSRMKEFGIRKVLGASSTEIALMQVRRFVKIALLADIIALPVAYLLLRQWLADFAYRTDLNYWWFVLVAGLTVIIALLSAGYAAFKSGRLNPVQVIKSE